MSDRAHKTSYHSVHTVSLLYLFLTFGKSLLQCYFIILDGDFLFNVDSVLFPTSIKEIQDIVREANENGQKLRVLGSGHSRSAIALSEDLYISLGKYRGLVAFDENAKLATFRGGTRLSQIIQELGQRGFTLNILPAIDEQTIAGAISTGNNCCMQ